MTQSYLAAARELRSTIDAYAVKAGDDPVPAETVQAMASAGLFGIMTPKELGGGELGLLDTIDVIAEVSRADGSAGWCLMASASTVAYFGAYAGEAFVKEMFADGVPLAAGQFAPNGTAARDGDGYRISGQYQFGSGIHYADWVGGGVLTEVPEGSDEPPQYLFTVVPKDKVTLRGNWDVLGLMSTASYDYTIDNVFVPEQATFLFAAPTRRRGGRLFELGVMVLTAAGHAGYAVGVTRRALDELMGIARTKVRMGTGVFLKDGERFLEALGTLESRLRSAEAWMRETFVRAEQSISKGGKVDPATSNLVRQATVHVTQEGADIVRRAYLLAGTTGLRASPLQRCFRDIHAGSQHFFASPVSTLDFGRDLMNAAPESALEA